MPLTNTISYRTSNQYDAYYVESSNRSQHKMADDIVSAINAEKHANDSLAYTGYEHLEPSVKLKLNQPQIHETLPSEMLGSWMLQQSQAYIHVYPEREEFNTATDSLSKLFRWLNNSQGSHTFLPTDQGEYPATLMTEYDALIEKKLDRTITSKERERLNELRMQINAIDRERERPDTWDIRARQLRNEIDLLRAEVDALPDTP